MDDTQGYSDDRWDSTEGVLADSLPMELHSKMPILHFKPVEFKKKSSKGVYQCPLYAYPVRHGSRHQS